MSPKGRKSDSHPDAKVYVIGPNELQNELLVWYLNNVEGYSCDYSPEFELPTGDDAEAEVYLILFDCLNGDSSTLWADVEKAEQESASLFFVALFNARPEEEILREAMSRKARGVFYLGTPLEVVCKGILAMLEGELWYSREALSSFLMEPKSKSNLPEDVARSLTPREKEILLKISAGASNKEIADGLFISLHTVKSHIYNIYRKIGVPNRLRAAKWVAKHLKT